MKYTVNSLAKLLNVSTNTIRRYTNMGYIKPEKNEINNYSYYSSHDINQIIRIRMYRKFGFSHNDIKDMLQCNVDGIIESFEKRIVDMENEMDKIKSLKNMLKANMIMVKRIEEFASQFITQDVEATYYVECQRENKLFSEKERLEAVHEFMYSLPETKEILIFKKDDIESNVYEYSFGFAAKKKDIDKFDIKLNKYMTFMPVQKCIYFLLKLFSLEDEFSKQNDEIKKNRFEEAKKYLEKSRLRINNNVLGFNITSAIENGISMTYTLICLPVEDY